MAILFDVIVAGLAVWQVVEVWHHSELSLGARRKAKAAVAGASGARAFVLKLISCPFCLSHWVAGIACLLLLLGEQVSPWFSYLVWIFAATRVANLGNDLSYYYNRTPKHYEEGYHDDGEDTGKSPP